MDRTIQNAGELVVFKKQSQLKEIWRRLKKDRLALFGLTVIAILILVAIFADLIIPYSAAIKMNLRSRLAMPSAAHWFGCDGYGRDMLARCVHGTRVSLLIGFSTSIASLIIGGFLGSIVAM